MLHTPGGGAVDPEWRELDRKLREGDGIMWAGDPRLSLGVGTLRNRKTGQTGRRLEVWRNNEDGSETIIGHWHPSEQFRILYDLAQMRIEKPGHVDVLDRIDAHNDALEAADSQATQESMIQTLDHALRLDHDRNNPANTFFLPGPSPKEAVAAAKAAAAPPAPAPAAAA